MYMQINYHFFSSFERKLMSLVKLYDLPIFRSLRTWELNYW